MDFKKEAEKIKRRLELLIMWDHAGLLDRIRTFGDDSVHFDVGVKIKDVLPGAEKNLISFAQISLHKGKPLLCLSVHCSNLDYFFYYENIEKTLEKFDINKKVVRMDWHESVLKLV